MSTFPTNESLNVKFSHQEINQTQPVRINFHQGLMTGNQTFHQTDNQKTFESKPFDLNKPIRPSSFGSSNGFTYHSQSQPITNYLPEPKYQVKVTGPLADPKGSTHDSFIKNLYTEAHNRTPLAPIIENTVK